MTNGNTETKYKMIALAPDAYEKVAHVAEMNNRTIGGQVKVWADEAMPKCGHPLQPVTVQTFPDRADRDSTTIHYKTAWYCKTCKRVYAEV